MSSPVPARGMSRVQTMFLWSRPRRTFQRLHARAGRGLAGCGRARATTESHDAGEAQERGKGG
eukprot:scaffold25311_cov51-Phaeocystis_antarctica.AAC.1